jgi:hypothetical protein
MSYIDSQSVGKKIIVQLSRSLLVVSFVLFLSTWQAEAQKYKCFLCTKPVVYMSVSLAKGTVRTPEFRVGNKSYEIKLDFTTSRPPVELECTIGYRMMGPRKNCKEVSPEGPIAGRWKVWEGERLVTEGVIKEHDYAGFATDYIDRVIGEFIGEKKKRYWVEVEFTTDKSKLNAFDPRLEIMRESNNDLLP